MVTPEDKDGSSNSSTLPFFSSSFGLWMSLLLTACIATIVALPLILKYRSLPAKKGKNGNGNRQQTSAFTRFWMEWLTEYRGVIMVLVVLPLSFLFELYFEWRDYFYRTFRVAPKLHDARVRHVQDQVKRWNAAGLRGKKLMCTARATWLTMSTRTATFKKDCNRIECNLRDILHVDTEKGFVRTEPLVDMRYMTRTLVPMGFQLAIQVEMEDLTIGGLCMGLGMETNSHRFGLIQETVLAFEIITSHGDLLRVTKEDNPELFYALPWSHGTLGFLVAVELKIIPIKPYIHIQYIPCHSKEELCKKMQELAEAEAQPEFLEATVYSKETSVIMVGAFAEVDTGEKRKKVNGVNYFWKPWYYLHVQEALGEKGGFDEYVPVRHYHHRFTRSVFWELRDLIPFGNAVWYRYLFGWLGAPKVSFIKLTMTPQIRSEVVYKHVVQDIIIPLHEMSRSIDQFHEWFEIYPLLIFPIAIFDHGKHEGFLRNPKAKDKVKNKPYQMYFDLGVYGVPEKVRKKQKWNAKACIRAMETYTRAVGGYQCLYADTFMTREEFREMFNHTLYDRMREKYDAIGAFPEIYDKISPEAGVLEDRPDMNGNGDK